jgi:hypothetical protein
LVLGQQGLDLVDQGLQPFRGGGSLGKIGD